MVSTLFTECQNSTLFRRYDQFNFRGLDFYMGNRGVIFGDFFTDSVQNKCKSLEKDFFLPSKFQTHLFIIKSIENVSLICLLYEKRCLLVNIHIFMQFCWCFLKLLDLLFERNLRFMRVYRD